MKAATESRLPVLPDASIFAMVVQDPLFGILLGVKWPGKAFLLLKSRQVKIFSRRQNSPESRVSLGKQSLLMRQPFLTHRAGHVAISLGAEVLDRC